MNASQHSRLNKSRANRIFKLAPMTRAIRSVLAVSATVLALSGSGVAFADTWTCVSNAAGTISCNGAFTETVPGTTFEPTVDLTLILGDSVPTSVIPLSGEVGVDASWGGMVGITSYADIVTDGADGIHQYGSTSATLRNLGSISTSVMAADANAVDISAHGDVTVVNEGDISANGSGIYDVTAVTAYSLAGGVRINNLDGGTITATAGDGNAIGVDAYVFGGYIRIYNDGEIAASSVNGDATGISALASVVSTATYHPPIYTPEFCYTPAYCYGPFYTPPSTTYSNVAGNIRVFSNGSVEASSDDGQAMGIYANALFGSSLVAVTSTGSVTVSGDELATGISASAGINAQVVNQGGLVSATANDLAIGIAIAGDRSGYVFNGGAITATSIYGDAVGVSSNVLGTSRLRNVASGAIVVTGAESATGIATSADTSYVYNEGAITVIADAGLATGIAAHDVSLTKILMNGSIDVVSTAGSAIGIDTSGATAYTVGLLIGGSTSVTGAYDATGLLASASYYASVLLNGSLTADAGTGDAIGIFAEVDGPSGAVFTSQVAVADIGTIAASSQYGNANGVWAVSNGTDSVVNNAGAVSATAVYGLATGIQIDTQGFTDASVFNSGSVDATGYQAVGIGVDTYAGVGYVGNSGDITVAASAVLARATGIDAVSQLAAMVKNSGSIEVTVGLAEAVGIYALGTNDRATVVNSGDINVQSNIDQVAYGDGYYYAGRDYSTGISASAEHTTTVVNAGDITAESTFRAKGVRAYAQDGAVAIDNSGAISVTADFDAWGIEAFSQIGTVSVDNSGSINVDNRADSEIGRYNFGIFANTQYGNLVSVTNSGNISVSGTEAGLQYGIVASGAIGPYFDSSLVSVVNTGDISVSGSTEAKGIRADLYTGFGWVDSVGALQVSNSGSITVEGTDQSANSWGIYAATNNVNVDSLIDNSGSIAVSSALRPTGITHLFNDGGTSAIRNSGDITAIGHYGAEGIYARYLNFAPSSQVEHGDLYFDNSGSITASNSPGGGFDSPYPISSTRVLGVQLRISDIDVTAHNSGSITAISTTNPQSLGEFATSRVIGFGVVDYRGDGEIYLSNTGSITASLTSDGRKHGTFFTNSAGILLTGSYGAAEVVNSGLVSASALIDATTVPGTVPRPVTVQGIRLESKQVGAFFSSQGERTVINADTGIVTASGISNYGDVSLEVAGIYAAHLFASDFVSADHGITIDNAGMVSASALVGGADTLGAAAATGISAKSVTLGFVDVSNSGAVSAVATAIAEANATGLFAAAAYGDAAISNSGDISGRAESGHEAVATGIALVSRVGTYDNSQSFHYEYNDTTYAWEQIYNVPLTATLGDITLISDAAGTISAWASSSDGEGATALANGISASVVVETYAASRVSAGTGITLGNAGHISATAVVANDLTGIATANGISAINGSAEGFASITNSGVVTATATATGSANATGIQASADTVSVALNAGSSVTAVATGDEGTAIGLSVSGDALTVSNAGLINARFIGGGDTYGALIASLTGDVTFTNSGSITATDADYAIGVQLDSESATTLVNSGTITAVSTLAGRVAVRTGASADTIRNTGTINGVLVTGDGDDTLNNAVGGIWNAVGSSDFGAGNDVIANAGTIFMNNATISLGAHGTAGNQFTNSGLIGISGVNAINMGALNPNRFTNTGTISFRDGVPDDMLTIAGDFGGSGNLSLDVSGLHGTSDLLYINGSVANGSVTTINARVLDVPIAATGSVALVKVAGDSSAGSFVLGNVVFDTTRSFLTVQGVSVHSVIDTSNVRPDVFSMDFAVTGLTDTGTLAAAFAPGVQSLMNSQVGTWRQRMGVIDKATTGLSVWARAFQDDGTVNPTHQANNFGQGGNFAFDQRNAGQEVGLDFGFSDQFSVGLLLGKAQARQHLSESATTTSKLDGTTSGVYGTWISPTGFYVDASYRHMSFDVNLKSAAGETRTEGKANAFNVEAGYGWTLGGGFKLEPQVQYTRTTVGDVDTLTGALAGFTPDGGASSRGRLGVALRKSFGSGKAVWTPHATVSAVREFDGENAFGINGNFTGSTSTHGSSALVEGGLNVQTGNLTVFGGVNWQDGGALNSVVGGQLGLRYSW